eukprot:gnl/Chilomastix_caulleri/3325.p1 GENE.gnl/Chilomastix_caulleri/3325~~gnl/Chilomastix_caulleri/3325.p1  ORF type:complete len:62 (+),score=9.63 gnl/Chilomastix_caulleri/3325:121-306(+)
MFLNCMSAIFVGRMMDGLRMVDLYWDKTEIGDLVLCFQMELMYVCWVGYGCIRYCLELVDD